MNQNEKWLEWAVALQSLAQAGIHYGKDPFDVERYEQIRTIAAEMISYQTEIPLEKVKNLFCNETGYQTPKLDSRAAIFQDEKILLVKERNGTWALPGGWVDVLETIRSNAEKEAREEAKAEFHRFFDKAKRRRAREGKFAGKTVCFSHPLEEDVKVSEPLLAAMFAEGGFYTFHAEDCDVYVCTEGETGPRLRGVQERGAKVFSAAEFSALLQK